MGGQFVCCLPDRSRLVVPDGWYHMDQTTQTSSRATVLLRSRLVGVHAVLWLKLCKSVLELRGGTEVALLCVRTVLQTGNCFINYSATHGRLFHHYSSNSKGFFLMQSVSFPVRVGCRLSVVSCESRR